jgi:flagellar export protein FliJ
LLGSQAKLEKMYQEYYEKNAANSSYKGMTDAMNQRQFMSQLLNLRERVRNDIERSETHVTTLAHHKVLAETERLKMQTLTENDRLAVAKFVEKREQSRMDEMGVMQFNRAQTP